MFNTYVNLSLNKLIMNFILIINYSVCNINSVSTRDMLVKKGESERMGVVELSVMCFIESVFVIGCGQDLERKRLLLLSQSIRGEYIAENEHTET